MSENKLRKKYRDKFRRKFGIKARELPWFSSAEEYEEYFKEKLSQKEFLGEIGFEKYGGHYLYYPEELDLAEEKLEEFFKRHIQRIGGVAQEGYEKLGKIYRQYYDVPRDKRKRLLQAASNEAIEAIDGITRYKEGHQTHEASLLVMQRILTGGEVLTMEEAYEVVKEYDNIEYE